LIEKHQRKGFNGSVLYVKNDSILFKKHYGTVDFNNENQLNDSTLFDLASNSKQFTALAIILLVEKGKISYDTKLDSLIKNFPYAGISIYHLLKHQSGLPDYIKLMSKDKVWNGNMIADNDDMIETFIKYRPKKLFEPGTDYKYSNTGYVLLATIVELISGVSFSEYMRENIFEPAQMKSTKIINRRFNPIDMTNITEGYHKRKSGQYYVMSKKKNSKYYFLDGIVGDGAVSSNLMDLFNWHLAMKNNRIITSSSKEKMYSVDSVSKTYGFGTIIFNENNQLDYYHGGSWAGFESWTYFQSKSNDFIVVLNNTHYLSSIKVLRAFF
jgi:CubicO group peptidase (beta-lactamase class C family)